MKNFQQRTGHGPFKLKQNLLNLLEDSPLKDDVKIFPAPLILQNQEYKNLQKAMAQRTLTFQELFYDLAIGEQKILNDPNSPLSKELVETVYKDAGKPLDKVRKTWANKSRDDIRVLTNRSPSVYGVLLQGTP